MWPCCSNTFPRIPDEIVFEKRTESLFCPGSQKDSGRKMAVGNRSYFRQSAGDGSSMMLPWKVLESNIDGIRKPGRLWVIEYSASRGLQLKLCVSELWLGYWSGSNSHPFFLAARILQHALSYK
jgi:hypothetical protein